MDDLEVSGCDALATLDGLEAVRDPYEIRIVDNLALTDVSALESAGSVTWLEVTMNHQLAAADAQALADALSVFGSATIGQNGP